MPPRASDLHALTAVPWRRVDTGRPELVVLRDRLPFGWSFGVSVSHGATVTVSDMDGRVWSSSTAPRLVDAVAMALDALPT